MNEEKTQIDRASSEVNVDQQVSAPPIYLMLKIWIDTLENRDAYGYTPFSYVKTKEEAEIICKSEYINVADYPWPLHYAWGEAVDKDGNKIQGMSIEKVDGAKVPRYKYLEIKAH